MKNVGFGCEVTNSQVVNRLNEIEKQLHSVLYSTVYKVKMDTGLTYTVQSSKHNLLIIRGVVVLNPQYEEIIVSVKISPDRSIRIESNIDLWDSMLIIF